MNEGTVSVTQWSDRTASPWKNGGGVTRELAAHPPGSGTDSFVWRVSVADVGQEGAFSRFPGVDRVITLLEGASMVLTCGAEVTSLSPLQPYSFSGDDAVACRLPDGPTRDLNVMTRRGRARSSVEVRRATRPVVLSAVPAHRLVVALEEVRAEVGGRTWTLGRYDVLESGGPLSVGPGAFVLVEIEDR